MKNILANISAIILVTFMQSAAQNQETISIPPGENR
jgi:hypothetical protein